MPRVLKRWVEHVGGKIRELRTGAGMTQADLAVAAGISPDDIRRLEDLEHPAAIWLSPGSPGTRRRRGRDRPLRRLNPSLAGPAGGPAETTRPETPPDGSGSGQRTTS